MQVLASFLLVVVVNTRGENSAKENRGVKDTQLYLRTLFETVVEASQNGLP